MSMYLWMHDTGDDAWASTYQVSGAVAGGSYNNADWTRSRTWTGSNNGGTYVLYNIRGAWAII